MAPRSRVVRDAIAIGAAVAVFGLSFGVFAVTAGLSPLAACALSLLMCTGASQFAAVGVLAAGGTFGAAASSAFLLGLRNIAYGVSLVPYIGRRSFLTRLLAAHLVLDETTAMATAHIDREEGRRAFWATGVSIYVAWNVGTLVGAAAGNALGDPATLGLDAALTGGFLALIAPQLRTRRGALAAVCGSAIAIILVPLAPAGVPIIAAAAGAVPALLVPKRAGEQSASETG